MYKIIKNNQKSELITQVTGEKSQGKPVFTIRTKSKNHTR